MTTVNKNTYLFFSRLCHWCNLLFFVIMLLAACRQRMDDHIIINWSDGRAVSVRIPKQLADVPEDSLSSLVQISAKNDTARTRVLGEFSDDRSIIFIPALPFLRGAAYEVFVRNKKVGSFMVPPGAADPTILVATFPRIDTVPENLLKIYFDFSHPMQEGRSAQYIKLIRNDTDTLPDVFLDLQPELWNSSRTVLTLWLDPGRIKRDLQPNLRLGSPLHKNDKYTLFVAAAWRDADGRPLKENYLRTFFAGNRDSVGPEPERWQIRDTVKNSKPAIYIGFAEPLDHYLLMDCLLITDAKGTPVEGSFVLGSKDDQCIFVPKDIMVKGRYTLHVESKLEDLAGNNINKPFDRDIKNSKQPSTVITHSKPFLIK